MAASGKAKHKKRGSEILVLAIAAFIAGVSVGAFVLSQGEEAPPARLSGSSQVIMGVPAVDASGRGVFGTLVTEVRPGTGKVLVNVIDVITLGDTQLSAQRATHAAAQFVNQDLSTVDVIFTIKVNASSIDGPSAGSSMATAIVFGLMNETPRADVMMTGTIDENGNIGKVGSILEKARVSKDGGAKIFVVPKGQAVERQTTRSSQCRLVGTTEHCRVFYESALVNISEKLNMTVVEAGTLAEAVKFFER